MKIIIRIRYLMMIKKVTIYYLFIKVKDNSSLIDEECEIIYQNFFVDDEDEDD